jgi:Arc/MetJ-type ribon-helix-helix transcriptional regulator
MEVIQTRLPDGLVRGMEDLVSRGFYTNKSDVMRDALRKLINEKQLVEKQIGTIPNTGDSVKEIREIRNKLSKEIKSYKDIEEINKLVD